MEVAHSILLYILDRLPQEEADRLRLELMPVYSEFMEGLEYLEKISIRYESVAKKIRARASMVKRLHSPMREEAK